MDDSLFYINNEKQHFEKFNKIPFFVYMLRLDYHSSRWTNMLLSDVAHYLFKKETPIFNKKKMMMNIVPGFFLEKLVQSKKLENLKSFTKNNAHYALFISAFCCNYCIDLYEEALFNLDLHDQELILEYDRVDTSILYEEKYGQFDSYPRELVVAQTHLFKLVQTLWYEKQDSYDFTRDIKKIIDDYRFNERDILKNLQMDSFFNPEKSNKV